MSKLFVWSAYRSGASLTISHSTGRLAGFDRVYYCTARHKVIAAHKDGREFELAGVEGGTEVL